jgi:hypothetical protein
LTRGSTALGSSPSKFLHIIPILYLIDVLPILDIAPLLDIILRLNLGLRFGFLLLRFFGDAFRTRGVNNSAFDRFFGSLGSDISVLYRLG